MVTTVCVTCLWAGRSPLASASSSPSCVAKHSSTEKGPFSPSDPAGGQKIGWQTQQCHLVVTSGIWRRGKADPGGGMVRTCQYGNLGAKRQWRQEGAHAGISKPGGRSTWKVLETVLPPPPAVKKGEEKSSGMGRRVGAVRQLFKRRLSGHFA